MGYKATFRHWQQSELDDLRERAPSMRVGQLAARYARSRTSVRTELARMGVAPLRSCTWSPDAVAKLRNYKAEGRTHRQIAEALGTTLHSVNAQICLHGLSGTQRRSRVARVTRKPKNDSAVISKMNRLERMMFLASRLG